MMIRLRTAKVPDASLLPEIERSSGRIFLKWPGLEWIADDDVQSVDRHLELIEKGSALVAEDQGSNLVGFLNGEALGEAFHICQVAVRDGNQRHGIGRQLMMAAQRLAMQRGLQCMTLTTFRKVPWNGPFYQGLGFHIMEKDDLDHRLRAVLDHEAEAGLALELRCAMIKRLR